MEQPFLISNTDVRIIVPLRWKLYAGSSGNYACNFSSWLYMDAALHASATLAACFRAPAQLRRRPRHDAWKRRRLSWILMVFFFFFSFICVHFLLKMSSHESLLLSNWNLSLLLLVAVPLNSFLLLGSTSSDHRASILTEGLSATCYSFTLKQDKPAAKNWTATDSQFVQTIQNTSLSSRTDLQVCVCVFSLLWK